MGIVVWLLLAEGLYLRALRILGARGVAVPRWQVAAWHAGIALQAIGLLSPIDGLADDGLSFHMLQHLLIADLAAPLLLAGMRNPVLAFLLPRSVLVPLARNRPLRRAFRTLRQPLVALPVYALVLYGWHFSFAFEAAVRNPLVHAAQHASFVAIGILVWWPALEPKRRRLRGELWKIGHILGARPAPSTSSMLRPTICAGVRPKRSAFALLTNLNRLSRSQLARITGTWSVTRCSWSAASESAAARRTCSSCSRTRCRASRSSARRRDSLMMLITTPITRKTAMCSTSAFESDRMPAECAKNQT